MAFRCATDEQCHNTLLGWSVCAVTAQDGTVTAERQQKVDTTIRSFRALHSGVQHLLQWSAVHHRQCNVGTVRSIATLRQGSCCTAGMFQPTEIDNKTHNVSTPYQKP